jgi:hypothetical protein
MRLISWLIFAGFLSSFGSAFAADEQPFTTEVVKQAFDLSKTCPKECANADVSTWNAYLWVKAG